jgi:myo-inositol-1(or 4)-monophosphatase
MNNWDIYELAELLSKCGKVAMDYYDNPPRELKADNSVVTIADKTVEKMLGEVFDKPENDSYMIGEETQSERGEDYIRQALRKRCWIVDPIDGTAPYTVQIPFWGISVAMSEDGVIKEGAIYFPALGELMITDGDQALLAENFVPGSTEKPIFKPYPFKKRPLDATSIISISQKSAKYARINITNQVIAWSTCVGSFAWVLRGHFAAYIGTLNLWDIAAVIVFMQRGGFIGRLATGRNLSSRISNEYYVLDSGAPNRWQLRGYVVVGPDEITLDAVQSAIVFNKGDL